MRAAVIRAFGAPLEIAEVPTPEPGEGEVLVEVKSAAINPSDVKNLAGAMHGTTLPRVPGRDFAGVVVAGPASHLGQEVFGTGGDLGFTRDGSHAQFVLLPASAVVRKPSRLSTDEAGSVGVRYVAAWSALVVAAALAPGEAAVVIGAAGGVGTAAVQIAKARGARVIGAVRSDEDAATAQANGADETVNTRSVDLADAVRSMTGGRGADLVFDTSGMMFPEGVEAAALGARLPVISAPADGKASFNLRTLYRSELHVAGVDTRRLSATACARLLEAMAPLFDSGQLEVQAGRPFPLAAVAEAYQEASRGGARVLLRPNE
jgi:NADPH2:quinone reductase